MKSNRELAEKITAQVLASDCENREENEQKGIELAMTSLNELVDKSRKGVAAALRIATLCYYQPEICRLAGLDQNGSKWLEDISNASCALANFDRNLYERIMLSIGKCPELYNIKDINEDVCDLPVE